MAEDNGAHEKVCVKCFGRGDFGEAVLQSPAEAEVAISRRPQNRHISSDVTCPHNAGSHGQYCLASAGKRVLCPYSFDYPYILKFNADWQAPAEIAAEFEAIKNSPDA